MNKLIVFILVFQASINLSWGKNLSIMSYNVENLFDTEHDTGKDDWEFIPMNHPDKIKNCNEIKIEHYKKVCLETDWTPEKLEIKLGQIDKVLKSVTPKQPDILVLIEVENKKVIEMLLKKTGYKNYIITSSPDARGVDLAILYNTSSDLKLVSSTQHKLKVSSDGIKSPTRNILEANFSFSGKEFSLLANHWPSQQSGPGSRGSAAKQLLDILGTKLGTKNSKIILVGDFNVTDGEKPNPMDDILTNKTGLVDVFSKWTKTQKAKLPLGTYFYGWDFTWNRLDRVIVNEDFLKGSPSVDPKSFNIYAPSFISREFEQKLPDRPHMGEKAIVPWGYWHNAYKVDKAGYSDHYPVQIEVNL